jgi:hypothetical protein
VCRSRGAHTGVFGQETFAPAPQRLGVVGPNDSSLTTFRPALPRRFAEGRRAGQQAAGEDVLLDEVGRLHVAVEQVVADRDALDAGLAARLELALAACRKTGQYSRPTASNISIEAMASKGPSAMSR